MGSHLLMSTPPARRRAMSLAAALVALPVVLLPATGARAGASVRAAAKSSSPSAMVGTAEAGTEGSQSFVCAGQAVDGKQHITFNVAISKSAASGTLTVNGQTAQLRRVFLVIYVKAAQGFYALEGLPHDQAELVANHWIEVQPSEASAYSDVDQFLLAKSLVSGLLPDPSSATITHSGHATLNGQPVNVIQGTFAGVKATVDVTAHGSPLVVRVFEPSPVDGGTINFSNYNKPVHVKVPKDVIGAQSGGGAST